MEYVMIDRVAGETDNEYGSRFSRNHRDRLIAETDWWATSDRTMSAEQTVYRQALRDIPSQAGFPKDITWPTKPE